MPKWQQRTCFVNPVVRKDAFYFVLVPRPPGGSGGGSGLSFSKGSRGFLVDSGLDPGGNHFLFLALIAAGLKSDNTLDGARFTNIHGLGQFRLGPVCARELQHSGSAIKCYSVTTKRR